MLISGLVLFLLVNSAQSWQLTTTHNQVARKVTQNITLSCDDTNPTENNSNSLSDVMRIRILKSVEGTEWETVAEMKRATNKVVSFFADATVSGHISGARNSFLTIHFNYANEETVGVYLCEINGFDLNDEIKEIKTEEMKVSERGISFDDLFGIIKDLKTKEEKDISLQSIRIDLLEKAVKLMQNKITVSNSKEDIEHFRNNSKILSKAVIKAKHLLKAQQDLSRQIIQNFRMDWPEGVYELFRPNSGCPISNSVQWQITLRMLLPTKGFSGKDADSKQNHLSKDTLQLLGIKNYETHRFCSKPTDSGGPAWPQGSYCINAYHTKSCPINFFTGTVVYSRQNFGGISNLPNSVHLFNVAKINYCCKSDRQAETPILLPSKNPFYLYRYKGKCQEVFGMKVTNEWIQVETEGTKDGFDNEYHPDLSIDNGDIRLQLCYYSPN